MTDLDNLVNAAPVAILVVDQSATITFINTEACRLFGYAESELLHQPIEILVPAGRQAGHVAQRQAYLANATKRPMGAGRDLHGRRKDGSEFVVEIALSPVETSDGACVLAAVFDITGRKRLQLGLEAVNRELEGFSYSVSHDLRAPVRVIEGFVGLLLKEHSDSLDDEGRRILEIIRRNTIMMGQLITDLLAFSHSGRKALTVRTIDMTQLAESLWRETQMASPGRNWDVNIGRLPEAEGDEALLRQVWLNLLSNASKYTAGRATASIQIEGHLEHHERVYSVKDNGVGFDMRYVDKLFKVFQRLHKPSEFPGTGIGLALVHRIISRHGGRVWAEGGAGTGATFFFSLPSQLIELDE